MAKSSVNSAQAFEYDLKLKETQIAKLGDKLTKSEVSSLGLSPSPECVKQFIKEDSLM